MKHAHAPRGRVCLAAICLLLLAVSVAGCTKPVTPTGAKTIAAGVLTLGTATPYPPFETKKGDTFVGFDMDIARAVALRLGLQLKVVNVAWEGLLPALRQGKFDMVIGALTITPERRKTLQFSDPYIDSNQSIAVRSGSGIRSEADLKGKVVGAQVDTTGLLAAKKIPGIKLKIYDTAKDEFADLAAGKLDAVINDLPASAWMVTHTTGLELAHTIVTHERYGIAFRQGNPWLVQSVNAALHSMRADGTYGRLCKKWFGKSL